MTLKTQITTDLDVFLNDDEYADEGTYTPTVGAAVTGNVILDQDYDGSEGVGSYRYFAYAKASFLGSAKPGDSVAIDGVTYKVKNPPDVDGTGMCIVELSID